MRRITRIAAVVTAAVMAVSALAVTSYAKAPTGLYEHYCGDVGVDVEEFPGDGSSTHIESSYKANYCVLVKGDTMAVWSKYDSFNPMVSRVVESSAKDHFTNITGTDALTYDWIYLGSGNGSFDLTPMGIVGNCVIDDEWKVVENADEVYTELDILVPAEAGIEYVCYGYYAPDEALEHEYVIPE